MPIVVLDDEIDGVEHDAVIIDQRQGALAMMRHVVEECGAKRVFFVGGLETNIDTQARYKAYRDMLQQGRPRISQGGRVPLGLHVRVGLSAGDRAVRDWAGPKHCVFAANDEMAAGIIAGANAMKVAVPDDLGVVGFDDTRVAQMTNPLLTTVRVPMSQHGRESHRAVVPADRRAGPPAGQSLAAGRAGGPRIVRLRSEETFSLNHVAAGLNHKGTEDTKKRIPTGERRGSRGELRAYTSENPTLLPLCTPVHSSS